MSADDLFALQRPAQGEPKGLVVLLHGVGSNERSLATLAQGMDPRLHVLLARAPFALGPDAHGWFNVRFRPNGPVIQPEQAEASRRLLIDWIGRQQQRLGVTPAQTLVAGFSQGGILSASVALTAPALVAGFGLLAGRILPEITPHIAADLPAQDLRGLVLHGRADDKLPYAHAEQSLALLQRLGVAHDHIAHDGGHGLDAALQAQVQAWTAARLLD